MKYEQIDWYDVPHYYDIIFDTGSKEEAAFLEEASRTYGLARGRRALEPACGSGRLVCEMSRCGWKVTGLDLNPSMIKFSRERLERAGLKAELKRADMTNFSVKASKRYDLAFCLVSTFQHLLTETAARSHLQCVADALKPGGIYVLGFYLGIGAAGKTSRERWTGERNGVRVGCNIQGQSADPKTRLEPVRSRLIVTEGKSERRLETNWHFRSYNGRQVRSLLKSVPDLELAAVHDFRYDLALKYELTDDLGDTLLILRKRL